MTSKKNARPDGRIKSKKAKCQHKLAGSKEGQKCGRQAIMRVFGVSYCKAHGQAKELEKPNPLTDEAIQERVRRNRELFGV